MDDKSFPGSSESKNVLPDLVHSQPVSNDLGLVSNENLSNNNDQATAAKQNTEDFETTVTEVSEAESISDHVLSKLDFSLSESEKMSQKPDPQVSLEAQNISNRNDLNIPQVQSISSETHDQSSSWPAEESAPEVNHISNESPVVMPASSEVSKEEESLKSVSHDSVAESSKNEFLDSLNNKTNSYEKDSINSISENVTPRPDSNSNSEEIIKLDIRGSGIPKLFPTAKIIFGPPPEDGEVVEPDVEGIPMFPNLLSPFLVGGGESAQIQELFDRESMSDKEQDVLLEEIIVEEAKEKKDSVPQPKSIPAEDGSFSTYTTDYKTICEEFQEKLVYLEAAISDRDKLISDLNITLQQTAKQRDDLIAQNDLKLEHKNHLSDFVKYENMANDTKFYSALESNPSSIHSNSEKDMDNEEITVDHSKTSESSDLTGFDEKLIDTLAKYDEFIADNVKNELREGLVRIFCYEVGKIRLESDTEIRELETNLKQNKHEFNQEARKLRELLASVKAGNADIEVLRQELNAKHEIEMENLRTYFEKKCSDVERSYSEEVYRNKNCGSPASCSSLEGAGVTGVVGVTGVTGSGDAPRRRTRSAELTLGHYESNTEQAVRQHDACVSEIRRHKDAIVALEDQIVQLKAHIQTTENTEHGVSLYQQDIDLELEKALDGSDLEMIRQEVREQVSQELQRKIQVLLSDPDAEPSSWPPELVALRDKIQSDVMRTQEKEQSGLYNEATDGSDKWKQRRNHSFDQNRNLEQVTKERDELKRVAVSLQRAVCELVRYCAAAEDELNRTVLSELLQRALYEDLPKQEDDSRPSTPNDQSTDLNLSALSRPGRHVHFAPALPSLLAELDEEQLLVYLQEQRDLSLDIKRELELSLRRLRGEAQDLLDLSCKLGKNKGEFKMLETSQMRITELVEEVDARQRCDLCEMYRKSMEEAVSEALQREAILRADLGAARGRLAALAAGARGDDFVAEGYGLAPGAARSLPPPRAPAPPSPPDSRSVSLDPSPSPRPHHAREMELLQRERDDLAQQLESANRQLRSARKFIEEQAAEREAERDEYSKNKEEMRAEISRLTSRLQSNARILNEMHCLKLTECNCRQHDAHVEQLEAQAREMNQMINDLERSKINADEELKASEEKITLLRDIISNLEKHLEQKNSREEVILKELEGMRKAIDERDGRLRELVGQLEALRCEREEASVVACSKCLEVEEGDLLEEIKEQARWLEESLHIRTRSLERVHEAAASEGDGARAGEGDNCSEDVSLADRKNQHLECAGSPPRRSPRLPLLAGVWAALDAQARAARAATKYVADLTRTAQEVRAERDVLQARMSEQALNLSSLAAKLEAQRTHAAAAARDAAGDLSVRLSDALAEVQRLTDEVETKDKQLNRLKQNIEDRGKANYQFDNLYGSTCNSQDKVKILERELATTRTRLVRLESEVGALESERDALRRQLKEREGQMQEILALKLDEENQKSENREEEIIIEGAKTSARTLSDIVSISDYDEQDLQMRKVEFRQNMSLNAAPYPNENKEKSLNRTLPPELQKPNMSSLNIDYTEHFDVTNTPRADSLPLHLTSTQNREMLKMHKKFNEVKIPDNCSLYPNRDASDNKDNSLEPKKINFSIEPVDNKTVDLTLRELGISLDVKQENFPDILYQMKHEIKKSKSELDVCKTELKNAEEQLCEFPALKEEVEELKVMLENTMTTMKNDKMFYEKQLENFTSNKKLLEHKLAELTQEVTDKSKDLHLLKEDILRRENMVLELAKEKRNLTNKMHELEVKMEELQNRNTVLNKYENENVKMREQIIESKKLEQLVSEKNQQIDSLNQHLDRLDDLQRRLDDKQEEVKNLKELLEEKSNEILQMQDTIEALNRDLANVHEDNERLNVTNKDLKQKLTKMEKEQQNQSLKHQSHENELHRLSSLNNELTSKIDELKHLADKLKERETEIEMLNEDIQSFHEEIASLKDQLKMVSRSPSPRTKETRTGDSKSSRAMDSRQLVRIRREVALLQHELDFNKKELNDKVFELARAKLSVTDLTASLSEANKQASEHEMQNKQLAEENRRLEEQLAALRGERERLEVQLQHVANRLREEANISELKQKLREKTEQCLALERELEELRDAAERVRETQVSSLTIARRGTRSPTAELELALRATLRDASRLDDDMLDQILSASSDNEDIPRLVLNSSRSSSSIHSSSSELIRNLRSEKEKLTLLLQASEARLRDKDNLIEELNRVRDKLVGDWQEARARLETEKESAARLQLLLDSHQEAAETVQNQDSNMIQILKKRLESAAAAEAELRRALAGGAAARGGESDSNSRLQSELSLLRSKLATEQEKSSELQAAWERDRRQLESQVAEKGRLVHSLRSDLLDAKRLKQEAGTELARARALLHAQAAALAELEKARGPRHDTSHTSDLVREMATLKQHLIDSKTDKIDKTDVIRQLRADKTALEEQVARLQEDRPTDDRDQAIRYLHGRCLRLESCRKALVWQKRYLQKVLSGYTAIEASLAPAPPAPPAAARAGRRFRCVSRAVLAACRLAFLVRRRRSMQAAAAAAARRPASSQGDVPPSSYTATARRAPARDQLRPDLRLNLAPNSPFGEYPRSPFFANSPRTDEPFLLSTPRSESTAAYLNKLE